MKRLPELIAAEAEGATWLAVCVAGAVGCLVLGLAYVALPWLADALERRARRRGAGEERS